jgi:membrane protease YdiL (CAAX protease family)
LGIWLWDHYFGKTEGYAPGTEEVALIKVDRDLRLADAMADDPAWLRWLAAAKPPVVARKEAMEVLQKLAAEKSISSVGVEAFAIIRAEQEGLPLEQTLGEALEGSLVSDFAERSRELANHRGTWWHAKWVAALEIKMQPEANWREIYRDDCARLKKRTLAVRSTVWSVGILGLAFVPGALSLLRKGLRQNPKGYGGAWTLPLGLVIFLTTTLAWIGFTMTLELGITAVPGVPPIIGIFLDSAARLLPPLIAIGLLFRKPVHAVRVMGLGRPTGLSAVFGILSLLMIADQILRAGIGESGFNEPGGGLSMGDAGYWGLAFAVVSACIVAPLAEETLHRGVLFRACWNRFGVLPGAFLSAAVFAGLHFYGGYGLASVGMFGFAAALLYAATGSLTTVTLFHMAYNLAIKIPEWIIYHSPL